MTKTLYFIRHGETEWNAERRMQGQWESDLTDRGRDQARRTAARVAALGVDRIYASSLRRARDSAQALADETGLTVSFDTRLMEWRAGAWSGHLYKDIMERWPAEWTAWRADQWRYRPPGAENFTDLVERGGAALKEILAAEHARIAIVSHGFITRAMLAFMLDLAPEEAIGVATPNDAFFRLSEDNGGWRAETYAGDSPRAGVLQADETPRLA